jgi:hypothetical protein
VPLGQQLGLALVVLVVIKLIQAINGLQQLCRVVVVVAKMSTLKPKLELLVI